MHRYDGYLGVALLAAVALIVVLAVSLATRPTVGQEQRYKVKIVPYACVRPTPQQGGNHS